MSDLVIITGASSGLGLALARSVPFRARTFDISRSGPPPESGIEHLRADLSDIETWEYVATEIKGLIVREQPERTVMIHAAGTLDPIGFAGRVSGTAYRRNIVLNSASGQAIGDSFLGAVRGRPGRHDLVMITSGAATNPYPGWSAYGAGKAALNQWVRTVGEEQRLDAGVTVSAIAPGVIDTPMQARIRSTPEEEFPEVDRFRRLAEEGELTSPANAAARLWEVLESGLETGSVIDLRDL